MHIIHQDHDQVYLRINGAAGRVRSFATGKGGARKADADLLRPKRKRKRGSYVSLKKEEKN